MNGYYSSSQNLTVGAYVEAVMSKADPALFKNSIYVQAVNRTKQRVSLLYDLSPFIVKNFDLETFAIIQSFISLFFILAGIFTLTTVLFSNTTAGVIASLLYTAELNNWTLGSPAPYLNFFHHGLPYAYPLIIWSLVFFFQKRFFTSSILAGISWNFHPMTTLFLLFCYVIYWILNYRKSKPVIILYFIFAFILFSSPTLIKSITYVRSTAEYGNSNWMTAVLWTGWYTCSPLTWPNVWIIRAGLFFGLFAVAFFTINSAAKKGIFIFTGSVIFLCFIGTIFADIYPIPFIIKLSLWRSSFLYLILAICCIGFFLSKVFEKSIAHRCLVIATIVILTGYIECFKLYYLPVFIVFLFYALLEENLKNRLPRFMGNFSIMFYMFLALLFTYQALFDYGSISAILCFSFIIMFFEGIKFLESVLTKKFFNHNSWVVLIVFLFIFNCAVLYNRGGPEIYYHGYIKGKIDPWADIQMFAQKHSDKDTLFIVPPYMNDFGIYSLRANLGDWAEGSNAIFLDNQFATEWLSRMSDIGWKTMYGAEEGYNRLTTDEIVTAAKKYGAKFVVTEKPKTFDLQKIYENSKFILYSIQPASGNL